MIDPGRGAALLTLIQRLPAEEQQMIADQLQAIQRAQAAGFQAIDPVHRQVIPTAAEVRARLERAQREGGYRIRRDSAGGEQIERVDVHL